MFCCQSKIIKFISFLEKLILLLFLFLILAQNNQLNITIRMLELCKIISNSFTSHGKIKNLLKVLCL